MQQANALISKCINF